MSGLNLYALFDFPLLDVVTRRRVKSGKDI